MNLIKPGSSIFSTGSIRPVSYVTLRYGTGFRCLFHILSNSGDSILLYTMLFLYNDLLVCVVMAGRVAQPSRPDISPVSDTSVMVRWTVAPPSGSLAIAMFKIQYRDMLERTATQGWQTDVHDIPASQRAFEVARLRPGTGPCHTH